ncbi:50S ribosomal protein L24 [Candidatus Parcubacteria bacterium]|nr:50S ribosomal protein L24 [Candidatus Parcubacteria bacterium]
MKIKKDDTIIVITGKDKGKTGKVLRAFPRDSKVIVDGVNIKKRHERSRRQDGKGKIVETSYPIHVSNVKKTK